MVGSWLVQRLMRPTGGIKLPDGKVVDNPFSFGGGYKNGGLSDRAMEIIRSIWEFDYMGSAEFEFGAVPKALQQIAKTAEAKKLVVVRLEVATKNDPRPCGRDALPGVIEGVVYGLCHEDHVGEVTKRIKAWAHDEFAGGRSTKETVGLERALREPDSPYRARGWLELDNGFLFFLDEEMFKKAAGLFGVATV